MKIEVYDLQLNFVNSYWYALDSELNFDVEVEQKNQIKVLIDETFESDVFINYYVYFSYQQFNYIGKIVDYEIENNSATISVNLDIDIFNNQVFNVAFFTSIDPIEQGVREYFELHDPNNPTPYSYQSNVVINTPGIEDSSIYDTLDNTFKVNDYIRKIQNARNVRVYLTLKYDIATNKPFIDVLVDYGQTGYFVIDELDHSQVLGDVNIDFQYDIPNYLKIALYDTDFNAFGDIYPTYALNNQNVVQKTTDILPVDKPQTFIPSYEVYEYDSAELTLIDTNGDLTPLGEDILLSFAIDALRNNYNNEITFTSDLDAIKNFVNSDNQEFMYSENGTFRYSDLVARYIVFVTINRTPIFTRVTSISVKNGLITIKLGASRKRLTDKLKRRL